MDPVQFVALAQVVADLYNQMSAVQQQLAEVKKERDELRAKGAEDEDTPAADHVSANGTKDAAEVSA